MIEHLLAVDAELTKAGVPPLSPWWKERLAELFSHPTARTMVGRVGRRGGKSTAGVKVAIAETVYREWAVPPGEVHWFVFISIDRVEAGERLRTLKHYLGLLGIPFDVAGDVITLRDVPLGFRVLTGSIGGVSGYSVIGAWCDEVAKWSNADHSANPCEEVIASLSPAMLQHPEARLFIMSSAFGAVGYHYDLIEAGSNEQNVVVSAATWEANPSITMEMTKARAKSQRSWLQEYANQPTAQISAAFDYEAVAAAFRQPPETFRVGGRTMVIDASSGRKDGFTTAIVSWCHPPQAQRYMTIERYVGQGLYDIEYQRDAEGNLVENPEWEKTYSPPFIRFESFWQQEGSFWQSVSMQKIVDGIALSCRRHGIHTVHGDQREALSLESMFAAHGLKYVVHTATNANKIEAVEQLQRWFADKTIVISPDEQLSPKVQQQLRQYDQKIKRSGAVTYSGRGSSHDDLAALLVTASIAELDGTLSLSPIARTRSPYALTNLPPG